MMRALALIFYYKNKAADFRDMLVSGGVSEKELPQLAPPSKATLDEMWSGNLGAFGGLKLMLTDTGILDDDKQEDENAD